MVDIIKQDMTDIWAVAGDVVAPDSAKVRAGWAVEAVPRQWWNWFENRQDTNIAYMLQKGIPEWDQFTEYLTNRSYVQRNNVVYKSILTGTNKDPATQPTYWTKAFPESSAYLETIRPLAVVNNTTAYINGAGTAVNTPITTFGLAQINTASAAENRTLNDTQQRNSNLDALSAIVASTNALPYFTGTTTMGTTTLTAYGRTLIATADAAAARTALGLTSAATTTVQTSNYDFTGGRLMTVGAFGLGTWADLRSSLLATGIPSDVYGTGTTFGFVNGGTGTSGSLAIPGLSGVNYGTLQVNGQFTDASGLFAISRVFITVSGRVFTQTAASGAAWGTWVESWSSGNLVKTTSTTDSTVGNMLKVGDFGFGTQGVRTGNADGLPAIGTGFYTLGTPYSGSPVAGLPCSIIHQGYDNERTQIAIIEGNTTVRYFVRKYRGPSVNAWQAWVEFWHTGNTSADVQAILGSANYSAVRSNLGLANKAEAGANSDITSLSGLTTPLSLLQGGTGGTTATGTGAIVKAASPSFSGNPSAPTQATNDNSTKLATTAYVSNQITALGLTPQSSPTDATAGRLMAVGAFGLGANGLTIPSTSNITATINVGFYKFAGGTAGAPPQFAGAGGSLIVHSLGGNFLQQIAISIPGALNNPMMCLRHFDTSGNPGSWVTFYTTGSTVGTVSVSGVTPTGAIIETGTNANGSYTKFTDGTLICQGPIADFAVGSNAIATLTPNGTFAHPFISGAYAASVLGAPSASNDQYGFTSVNSRATSAVNFVHRNGPTAQSMVNIRYEAIGRWF